MHNLFDRVLLVRHGQTEWNLVGRRQGQLDSPLTAAGVAQAHRTASFVTGDAIFTSPLGRACTTARIIASATGLSVTVTAGLAEVDHGDFAGLTNEDLARDHPTEARDRAADKYTWRFPNGESYADADARAARALVAIAERTRRPVIVSHEMIGRMLVRNLLDLTPVEALGRHQPHNVILVVARGKLEELDTAWPARRPPGHSYCQGC